jgi:hypothetical protein
MPLRNAQLYAEPEIVLPVLISVVFMPPPDCLQAHASIPMIAGIHSNALTLKNQLSRRGWIQWNGSTMRK